MVTESLDTNVLLRLLLNDIPEQFDQVESLLTREGTRFLVVDVAVLELVHALEHHYTLSRSAVADIITSLLEIDCLWINDPLFQRVVDLYLHKPQLSFTDCYLVEYAVSANATPLWTFDKDLARKHEHAQLVPRIG